MLPQPGQVVAFGPMAKHLLQAICVAGCISAAAPALALTPRDLAGWWLAIDGVFSAAADKSGSAAEELLVLTADGAVEDRAVFFRHPSAFVCAKSKLCSDAPLVSRARLTIEGDKLAFAERAPAAADGIEPALAAAALTATPSWTATLSAGNSLMTLRAGDATRILAKVDPDRLRRLRAGLMTAGLPAEKHWRCFLANATASDAAFAPLRKGKHVAPPFLADYLRIASYRSALGAMGALPTADDPDADRRALAGAKVETLLVERFKDVDTPRTAADARRYRAQGAFIDQRARNASPQEANVVASGLNGGAPVTVFATAPEFSALNRVTTRDSEAKRLFCVE
jgi:hypothetical protein